VKGDNLGSLILGNIPEVNDPLIKRSVEKGREITYFLGDSNERFQ
jgi:hypothetical protein